MNTDTLKLEDNIMGGYFKFIVTNSMDCLNRYKFLTDVFRSMNPKFRRYTLSGRIPNLVVSRLDMLWISHHFAVNPS